MTMKSNTLIYLFATILWLAATAISAQTRISGTVVDSASSQAIGNANVMLSRSGHTVSFTRSSSGGTFAIEAKNGDFIVAAFLGYKKQSVKIPSECFNGTTNKSLTIRLSPTAFALKEVNVSAGRLVGKADTISFDIGKFADKRDNSLKDVLKKLPGIDVADNGQVSFNGKAINRFAVEGMDMTGGRYNKLNETLKAKDVDKAEVIDHDQPIKALQGKVFSDAVALNIKLKPEAHDRWLATLRPGAAAGFPLKTAEFIGSADAIQIGKKRQRMYDGEYDRSGRDVSQDNDILAFGGSTRYNAGASTPQWLAPKSLQTPIDASRMRFNRSHDWSIKGVSKTKKGSERRITAGYLHATEDQQTRNQSIYFRDGGKSETTDEMGNSTMRKARIYIDLSQNTNTEKAYGNEYFLLEATKNESFSNLRNSGTGSTQELVKMPELRALNSFSRLWSGDRRNVEVSSELDFHYAPMSLNDGNVEKKLRNLLFHTDENATLTLERHLITHRYTFGVEAEHLNIESGNTKLAAKASPNWQYRKGKTRIMLDIPMEWAFFSYKPTTAKRHDKSVFAASPSVYANIRPGNRTEWIMASGLNQNNGTWADFALGEYQKDYRTTVKTNGVVPKTSIFHARAEFNYKRPIRETFFTATLLYNRQWANTATDIDISNGQYILNIIKRDNHSQTAEAKVWFSKGFYKIYLKTKLSMEYAFAEGLQLYSGVASKYRSNAVAANPEITFSPSFGTFTYKGRFGLNWLSTDGMAQKRLLGWRQEASYTQSIGPVDLTLAAVHHRSQLQSGSVVNALLADASAVWRMKKARLALSVRNLFDKCLYATTTYGSAMSSTTYYELRPREIVLSAQISL